MDAQKTDLQDGPLAVMMGGADERAARASLYAKMAHVLGAISRIPKNGYNTHFKYAFATASDITDAVRAEMSQAGLCMFVSIEDVQRIPMQTRSGETTNTVITLQISICDGDTGVCWISSWKGEGIDNQDKGISKAVTAAVKYFLIKTFMISTGDTSDDPDGYAIQEQAPRSSAERKASRDRATRKQRPSRPTDSNGDSPFGPTQFYTLAKGKHLGAGKKFADEAAIKAYVETHKGEGGYNWKAAIEGLGQ